MSSIARLLGVSRSTIYKYVPELGDHGQPAIDAGQTRTLSGDEAGSVALGWRA